MFLQECLLEPWPKSSLSNNILLSIPQSPVSFIKAFFCASCSKQLWNIAEFMFMIFFYILFAVRVKWPLCYTHIIYNFCQVHGFKVIRQLIVKWIISLEQNAMQSALDNMLCMNSSLTLILLNTPRTSLLVKTIIKDL